MTHAVHYETPDGDTRFEQMDSLEKAVARVEHLRNEDGIEQARVFRHIPIEFKTYYRVAVVDDDGASERSEQPAAEQTPPRAATPPPGSIVLGSPQSNQPAPSSDDDTEDGSAPATDAEPGDDQSKRSLFTRG